MDEGLVVNIDYPLTFLEFYETLLICIFMVLELEMKKEQRILMEQLPPIVSVVSVAPSKSRSAKTVESDKKVAKKGKKEDKEKTKKKKKKA